MPDSSQDDAAERISLHGQDPEAVLRALLAVDPNSESLAEEESAPDDRCTVEGWGAGRVERCTLPANHLGTHQLG
jgi:hypothetical protein